MLKLLRRLASLKITLIGLVLLIAGSMASYGNPMDVPVWVLVVPLMFLAINLTCAIITNNRINGQPGLLVFHVALLGLVILAGIGRLTHLEAHTEIPIGTEFKPGGLLEVRRGVWHAGDLDKVAFIQGPFTVEYAPGMKRGLTFSHVMIKDESGQWVEKVIGDDRVLVLHGYRFYTTNNKGFTALLTWTPENGKPITGTLNMPSYPLLEYKQDNHWTPPGGNEIKFWLQVKSGLSEDKAWTLDARNSTGTLVVTSKDVRNELNVGDTLKLPGGELKFEKLTMWMGYRLFYDPTIQWMFFVAVSGVCGLGYYFWRKINLQPWMEEIEDEPRSRRNRSTNDFHNYDYRNSHSNDLSSDHSNDDPIRNTELPAVQKGRA